MLASVPPPTGEPMQPVDPAELVDPATAARDARPEREAASMAAARAWPGPQLTLGWWWTMMADSGVNTHEADPVGAPALPRSAVSARLALGSLALYVLGLAAAKWAGWADPIAVFLLLAGAVIAPHLGTLARAVSAPVMDEAPGARQARTTRVAIKIQGLAVTVAAIALGYWIFPFYRDSQVADLLALLWMFAPALVVAIPAYLWITDARMAEPRDGLYMAGLLVLGRTAGVDWGKLRQHGLGWLVKGFFLPLMLTFLINDIRWWTTVDLAVELSVRHGWYEVAYRVFFMTDVLWATVGYLMTMRLLNTHIRSSEPTYLGWIVCLVCYPPFWPLFYANFVPYNDDLTWGPWLNDVPVVALLWAIAILTTVAVYVWATVSFGIRFSNLTHRGIITNGPYRFTKHPAYISKNLSWWLVSVPFVSTAGSGEAVRMCLMLLIVNGIYYLRAITEERHLSSDPVYLQYAAWIAQHGAVAALKRQARRLLAPGREPLADGSR